MVRDQTKMSQSKDFIELQGQTNPSPYLIEVDNAKGVFIYDKNGKELMDMIAGVAVNNIGHNHPKVIEAIKEQVDRHLHVMVYGEYIQDAQLGFARKLSSMLPNKLNTVYPVNSGTEANEAALKLAKRLTGRYELVAFKGSYHGSTQGSMSVSANESKKEAFRPLMPGIRFLTFNNVNDLKFITKKTAGVIIETIQGDAGVRIPNVEFMQALRRRCNETGTVLIFDEIQCGIGRTGKNFAFEHFNVIPDIITLGKALGGGMPIGALVSSCENLNKFTENPVLGHITTFGGHPVICAAAKACLEVIENEIDYNQVEKLGKKLEDSLLSLPEIKAIRRIGLMFACDMESQEIVAKVVDGCLNKGLISFWFLSNPHSFRLSPPLTISEEEIDRAGRIIIDTVTELRSY